MVAIGADGDGCREAMGAAEGFAESPERWRELLSRPRPRGLRGARMFTGDEAAGVAGSIAEAFPEAARRRRTVRFCRNVPARAPKTGRPRVAAMLKAARAMESREAAGAKALEVASELGKPRLGEAATAVGDGCAETPTHARSPRERWRRIGTDDAIGRLNRGIRRRTRVVGAFPDGRSALMLVAARPKHVAESSWGSRRYLNATLLDEQPYRKAGRLGCRKVRKNLDGTRYLETKC